MREIVENRSVISNSAKILRLADRGLHVTTETAVFLVSYLRACISNNPELIVMREYSTQFGWVGDGMSNFLPWGSSVKFDGGIVGAYMLEALQSKGDLGAWVSEMNKLRSNPQLRIMMATSFASPALGMLGGEVFVVSVFGSPMYVRTLALKCAASIWGGRGMIHALCASVNQLRQEAACLRHLPLLADNF
jgi:hypothetical protein